MSYLLYPATDHEAVRDGGLSDSAHTHDNDLDRHFSVDACCVPKINTDFHYRVLTPEAQ
jgi:hypothetical protein